MATMPQDIDPLTLDTSIKLLKKYVHDPSIEPLITALEALKESPNSESLFGEFTDAFAELGIVQGAVLTYAPYLSTLLSNDLFD